MAPSSKFMNWGKNKILNFSKDPANMLLWTATLGWIFSSAGQLASIITNKKISKKEKKFLVPQEAADAAINIFSFFVVTRTMQGATKKLVSKGKILTPKIKELCKKYDVRITKDKNGVVANIGEDIAAKIKDYQGILNINKADKDAKINLAPGKIKILEQKLNALTHLKNETYGPFENGLSVIGNIVGGVISGNIITPMLRNPMASYKQKTSMEQEKMENDAKLYNENRVILAQNDVDKKNTINRPVVNPYPPSGALKI